MFLSSETASFYAPMIADDGHPGTIFAGMGHIWRTTDNGGDQTFLEAPLQHHRCVRHERPAVHRQLR